ncbi:oxidoreductase [Vibrio sp. SM6]|uniref:Oxidoreductase n=1 Tax=Vibrio agarilyticus TaxID=2726741 RepID=A0A7X8YH35_9VIBR|nr:NAD(P)H-binding protein [Vibrio agarilyticus]NLS12937.1 oxidoreductase [Vibrio agarilyticus]
MTQWDTELWDKDANVIIAGATGLTGRLLLEHLLYHEAITQIYSLSRHTLSPERDPDHKLIQLVSNDLSITDWRESYAAPTVGYICLGTTLKDAGSQSALEKIDVDLVCHTAQTMKLLGVKRIGVVSCDGAKANSFFHYLRCKGRMEQTLTKMGFEQVVFAQPGPLRGQRNRPRPGEKGVEALLTLLKPLMWGRLQNFLPVDADVVAQTLLYRTFASDFSTVERWKRRDMLQLLRRYAV